jgi:hypothetical protein
MIPVVAPPATSPYEDLRSAFSRSASESADTGGAGRRPRGRSSVRLVLRARERGARESALGSAVLLGALGLGGVMGSAVARTWLRRSDVA